MKKCLCLGLFCFVAFLSAGCNEPGMNVKMASADAGCGVAIVGVLENVPPEKFEKTKLEIINIATELKGFVETGELSQLPLDEVKIKLENLMLKKGWSQYFYIVDTIIQYVKTQSVNVDKIGKNNVTLIKIGLEEIIRNTNRCTLEGLTQR